MARKEKKLNETAVLHGTGNVFADLGLPNPEEHLEKAKLVLAIQSAIEQEGLSQTEAAERLGIDQPQVSRMLRGQFRGYSIERLCKFLNCLGYDVTVVISHRQAGTPGRLTVTSDGTATKVRRTTPKPGNVDVVKDLRKQLDSLPKKLRRQVIMNILNPEVLEKTKSKRVSETQNVAMLKRK